MEPSDQEYVPGKCNIGPSEVRKRKVLGWIGLMVTLALWGTLIAFKAAPPWRLFLFLPAVLAALGFLQASWRFCVMYGLDGAFKFGRKARKSDSPQQAEFRRKDRRTAFTIIGLSTLAGVATAAAGFLIPL